MNLKENKHLSFPFRIGTNGRTAQTISLDDHIRDEIMQLLLTNPGERQFLPKFGGGVRQLIFSNVNDLTLAKTKSLITESLSNWLGERIEINKIEFESQNEKVLIKLEYKVIGTNKKYSIEYQKTE